MIETCLCSEITEFSKMLKQKNIVINLGNNSGQRGRRLQLFLCNNFRIVIRILYLNLSCRTSLFTVSLLFTKSSTKPVSSLEFHYIVINVCILSLLMTHWYLISCLENCWTINVLLQCCCMVCYRND